MVSMVPPGEAFCIRHFKLLRGWGSVDVTLRGQTFRFINTHLEQDSAEAIQEAQGDEILSGPANTSLPVILVGDFNSRADGNGTDTYDNLIGAGYKDAWSATHPGEPGNTWGHDENLLNTTVNLTQRIDLVLFRNTSSVTPNLCALDADPRSLRGAYLLDLFREGLVFRDELVARLLLGFGALLPE